MPSLATALFLYLLFWFGLGKDRLQVPDDMVASPDAQQLPRLSRMLSMNAFQGASSLGDAFKQRSETSALPMTRSLTTTGLARNRQWPDRLDIIIYYYRFDLMIFSVECSARFIYKIKIDQRSHS